jgi:aminocarboxymuconate-semialdehyde decarboxylase
VNADGLVVDVHCHFVPPDLVGELAAAPVHGVSLEQRDGARWLSHRQGYAYPLHDEFLGGEAKLADMDRRGIDVSLLSIAPPLLHYDLGPDEGEAFARRVNDALAKAAAGSSGRLPAVATVPLQDPERAARELRRAVEELGAVGVEIGATMEGRQLDDDAFLPFWEAADSLAVPVILHPYYVGPKPGLTDYYLTNLYGNPLETGLAALRLIFSGLLDRLARLRILLVHAGGFLPYQVGRYDHGWRVRQEPKRNILRPPSEYLDRFYFDTITHDDHFLGSLTELVGPEHVLLGTDLPFDMSDPEMVDRVGRVASSEEERRRIVGGNAIDLFGIHELA